MRIDSICRYYVERDEMEFVEDKQETDPKNGIGLLRNGSECSTLSGTTLVRTVEGR